VARLVDAVVQAITFGSLVAIAALGFGLIYSTTRIFHIAYGAVATFSVYAVQSVVGNASNSVGKLVGGFLLGCVVAVTMTVVIYVVIYRFAERRGSGQLQIFALSLGLSIAIIAAVSLQFGFNQRSFSYTNLTHNYNWGPLAVNQIGIATVVIAFVAYGALALVLGHTKLGYKIRAVSVNRDLAVLMGIRLTLITLIVWAGAAVASAGAYTLYSLNTSFGSASDFSFFLLAVVAVFLGGIGRYSGTLVASLVIGLVDGFVLTYLPAGWFTAIMFGLFLLIIVVFPRGFVRDGAKRRLRGSAAKETTNA
jgi:branched-chain amino acid transport system permease protein